MRNALFLLAFTAIAFVLSVSTSNAEITEVGFCDTPGTAKSVAVSGQYAYVADGWDGVRVIDISDPENPFEVGSCDAGHAWDICVSGDHAIVAAMIFVYVIDISNPEDPYVVGSYIPQGLTLGISAAEDYAYVADYDRGLCILDIGDPTTPSRAGSCDTPGLAYDAAVVGDFAYIADGENGVCVIDISDPQRPFRVGSSESPGFALDIAVAGDYAYTANNQGGFSVTDISDPENPFESGHCSSAGNAYDVFIADSFAFVAHVPDDVGRNEAFRVFDITDPENPNEVEEYDTPGVTMCTYVAGRYAYVADDTCGLRILDVSDYIPEQAVPDDAPSPVPADFTLLAAYPNPFNSSTTIRYGLPVAAPVSLQVYNTLGQQITTLFEGYRKAGFHTSTLSVADLPSGLYFVHLKASNQVFTSKIMLIR